MISPDRVLQGRLAVPSSVLCLSHGSHQGTTLWLTPIPRVHLGASLQGGRE